MKKENIKQESLQRPFRLAHQNLVITGINFANKTIVGFTELFVCPLRPDLKYLKLNSKQSRIFRVCVNDLWDAEFLYTDPMLDIGQEDQKRRDLNFFSKTHLQAVLSVEPDNADGELTIYLPDEVTASTAELKPFRLCIEYALERPNGGIQFVVPDIPGSWAEKSAHLFTCGVENSSRLWFPCVDTFSEPCTWKMEFTVPRDMVAVSSGDLIEVVYTSDLSHKTYHYHMSSPTAAPNIALAVGPFETVVDSNMHEVTHFCLPGLVNLLKHTTSTLHEAFEFYEELMSSRYPYSCYKQVFVDQAYQDVSSYATISIFSTNLLHSARIIDQTPISRTLMASAVAHQFFGCFLAQLSWNDTWLLKGITGFLTFLYIKKFFGNNEYRYRLMMEIKTVCDYEQKVGGIILNPRGKESWLHFPVSHPHVMSHQYMEIFSKKAHLVFRVLELHVGLEHLLQALNKLLALASQASQQKFICNTWMNTLVSNTSFQKVMATVTGKDVKPIINQWVTQSGCIKLQASFVFNRKRNVVELEVRQDHTTKGTLKYAGPLTVVIQELDGSFKHVFNIEDNRTKFEITCHSKSRRNKKKRIPLMTGEEIDMDLTAMDADSPVLWLRLDPDMLLLRDIQLDQPDYMWQYQLRYERDVVAQHDAISSLRQYSTPATRLSLTDTLENEQCFYRIRIDACYCLAQVANSLASSWAGPPAMMMIFRKMFGSNSCPSIIRQNNFTNFQQYFLLNTIPRMMATLRTAHNICPTEVFKFLLDLVKYNDNSKNKYSDNYYRANLVDSFASTITPAVTMVAACSDGRNIESLSSDTRLVLEEITRCLNLEKLLPSYRYTVTVSCLKAVRVMQRFGHLPSDSSVFRSYAQIGVFIDVRLAAIEVIIDLIRTEMKTEELKWLLDFAENESEPYVKHRLFRMLVDNPPFSLKDPTNCMNTSEISEKLWTLMNKKLSHDHRLRCDVMDLYFTLYGNIRPTCLSLPEIVSIPIKETKPVADTTCILPVKQEANTKPVDSVKKEVTATEDTSTKKDIVVEIEKPLTEGSLKRKASQPLISSPRPLESASQAEIVAVPMRSQENATFKLKIKIGSATSSRENSPHDVMVSKIEATNSADSIRPYVNIPQTQSDEKPTEPKPGTSQSMMRVASWSESTSHLSEEDSSSPVNSPQTSINPDTPGKESKSLTFEGLIAKATTSQGPSKSTSNVDSISVKEEPRRPLTLTLSGHSFSSPHSRKKKKREKHRHKHKHKHKHDRSDSDHHKKRDGNNDRDSYEGRVIFY